MIKGNLTVPANKSGKKSDKDSEKESSKTISKVSGKELLEGLLEDFATKDVSKVMGYFADDATFYDPHYPQPRMVGKEAILQGMTWAFGTIEKPGFKVRHIWLDGDTGAAEVDTHHIIKGGMESKLDQVFVFEVRDGKFTRLQSYVPYAPHGIPGMIGNVTKLVWRLQGKIK
jgi:ketosteroid isomerase-like protein